VAAGLGAGGRGLGQGLGEEMGGGVCSMPLCRFRGRDMGMYQLVIELQMEKQGGGLDSLATKERDMDFWI
jgi:hypothetical protein